MVVMVRACVCVEGGGGVGGGVRQGRACLRACAQYLFPQSFWRGLR